MTLHTTHGDLKIELFVSQTPKTCENFIKLCQKGYYDGTKFHRSIRHFMIQGGDPTGTGTGGPGYKFDDELPEAGEYKLGSLAMANSGPNTNGSQFFIVSGEAGVNLPPLYTLFGEVTEGMDIVNAIQDTPTAMGDKPVDDVVIEGVELIEG